jgi:hypothetical protein
MDDVRQNTVQAHFGPDGSGRLPGVGPGAELIADAPPGMTDQCIVDFRVLGPNPISPLSPH